MVKQLQELGLPEKEARVYLAALELGSSTVQNISRKSGVNRATAYLYVESLIKRGLMSSVIRGKKRYFNAESPDQLVRLLEIEKKEIDSKKEEFEKRLPELQAIFNLAEEKPKVRFFEGVEGIRTIQKDILDTKEIKEIDEFVSLDDAYEVFPPNDYDHRHDMEKKLENSSIRVIYTSSKGPILLSKRENEKYKFVPKEKMPFHTEIAIYNDKVAFISYKSKLLGVIIENKEIFDSMRAIFNLAWGFGE